ncbi:recombinase family protein [Croceibacterium ferulae]|uniref:recombinase family protein n=1 Tax=Croceibacterium ferulae TaxID=1854641 RepID=UPI000EAF13B3|nr:recombinase family protein [Croceibacterium ferulae]
MFIRAYLRASTAEQDAARARSALDTFAATHGFRIAARYIENESGSRLARPELFRLLDDCGPGDVLLVEQVDRLSRLGSADWAKLRAEIETRQIRVVSLDLPTSWNLVTPPDEFTARMFAAVNSMMLDVLAAVARKDYEDRRRRQEEGVQRARTAGLYKGRQENLDRNDAIAQSMRSGQTWREIMSATGCSRTLLAKIARRLREDDCVSTG